MSKETTKDEMLNLCIQQGYVPPECTLTGMIVFGFEKFESLYLQEKERYLKKERERNERINRKSNGLNNNGFMFVDTDIGSRNRMQIIVMVMKPLQEEMYVQKFEDISIAASYIPSICAMYDIQQVYIDIKGSGKGISEAIHHTLIGMGNNKIDVVPMRAKVCIY